MKTKILAIVGILLFIVGYILFPHKSDNKMEQHFLSNEEDFNTLVKMFGEDSKIDIITGSKISPFEASKTISDERLREYKRLLDKTKISYGIRRIRDKQKIVFITTSDSSEPDEYSEQHTTSKGYVYSPTEPSPVVESLENINKTSYKKLKENWYLYYAEGNSKPE